MASFETDLARYLHDYDVAAHADEAARAEFGEDYDLTYHVMGEDASLIPEGLVIEPSLWVYRDDRECASEG